HVAGVRIAEHKPGCTARIRGTAREIVFVVLVHIRAATDDAAAVAAAVIEGRSHTEPHAQVTREVLSHNDDTRLDHDLAHRNVERRYQPPNVGETLGRILQQQ